MEIIVFDLEATCWTHGTSVARQEIIEIGAVALAGAEPDRIVPTREYGTFVRPVSEPHLSDFCMRLTSIRQSDVDDAPLFPQALEEFVAWIGEASEAVGSWGRYDLRQLESDCRRHGIMLPAVFARHVNLKDWFARVYGRPGGVDPTLRRLGLGFDGTLHRALDDARNIARIVQHILPRLRHHHG